MSKQNILVIGPAKTGTTIISKTIQHSISNAGFHLEPKEILFFEDQALASSPSPQVVKIIFEHWNNRPRMRNAIVHNETRLRFDKVIGIRRDPRDELISRLLYIVLPYTVARGYDDKFVKAWIDLWRIKEQNPEKISIKSLIAAYNRLTNTDFLVYLEGAQKYPSFLNAHKKRIHSISYESFIQGNNYELEKHLGFDLTQERSVDEFDRTTRSCASDNWKRYFLPEDVEYFKDILGDSLITMSYTDWSLTPVKSLNPEHCSNYLARLIQDHAIKPAECA